MDLEIEHFPGQDAEAPSTQAAPPAGDLTQIGPLLDHYKQVIEQIEARLEELGS